MSERKSYCILSAVLKPILRYSYQKSKRAKSRKSSNQTMLLRSELNAIQSVHERIAEYFIQYSLILPLHSVIPL